MEDGIETVDASSAVKLAKEACNIDTLNFAMSDEEISTVAKWIGQRAPDTVWVDGKPEIKAQGISAMLFITLSEFPRFYEKYGLSQFN